MLSATSTVNNSKQPQLKALIVGGTGNVGLQVVRQLLERGASVKAIARSPFPEPLASNPNLTIVNASLLDLPESELAAHVKDMDAVICTLGHRMNYGRIPALGVWMPPYRLVLTASERLCNAIESLKPAKPVKFIQLNTVGVANPDGSDNHVRKTAEATFLWFMSGTVPPYSDSWLSLDYLHKRGKSSKYVEWCAVRPDSFVMDGGVSEYLVQATLFNSIFDTKHTRIANIGHFITDLVTKQSVWDQWRWCMPVIIDKET
ncbi:hypothetical protein HDV05_006137 [Chytridiales sp. JEL 0842]|nr:hypothetical protein HDV05_006137 [Chytridiales sp. JEL 0842]